MTKCEREKLLLLRNLIEKTEQLPGGMDGEPSGFAIQDLIAAELKLIHEEWDKVVDGSG